MTENTFSSSSSDTMDAIDDFEDEELIKVSDVLDLKEKILKQETQKKRKMQISCVQLTYRQQIALKSSKLEKLVPQFRIVNRKIMSRSKKI